MILFVLWKKTVKNPKGCNKKWQKNNAFIKLRSFGNKKLSY